VDAQVMDTYVKSCAGYCVITFLLAIGDRHLDNVMLQVRVSPSSSSSSSLCRCCCCCCVVVVVLPLVVVEEEEEEEEEVVLWIPHSSHH
jgi:hypothetical protein